MLTSIEGIKYILETQNQGIQKLGPLVQIKLAPWCEQQIYVSKVATWCLLIQRV